jgi:hypothetical protein
VGLAAVTPQRAGVCMVEHQRPAECCPSSSAPPLAAGQLLQQLSLWHPSPEPRHNFEWCRAFDSSCLQRGALYGRLPFVLQVDELHHFFPAVRARGAAGPGFLLSKLRHHPCSSAAILRRAVQASPDAGRGWVLW